MISQDSAPAQVSTLIDARPRGWFWLDNSLVDEHAAIIGPIGLGIYCTLARLAGQEGHCFPSTAWLCRKLGVTPPTIRKYLKILVETGLISVTARSSEAGDATSNLYTLLPTPSSEVGNDVAHPGNVVAGGGKAGLPRVGNDVAPTKTQYEEEKNPPNPPRGGTRVTEQQPAREPTWERFLALYPSRSGNREVAKGREKFLRLLKAGEDLDTLMAGVGAYRDWCAANGKTGTELVKQIPTWLNGRCWEEDWSGRPPGVKLADHLNGATKPALPRVRMGREDEAHEVATYGMFHHRRRGDVAGDNAAAAKYREFLVSRGASPAEAEEEVQEASREADAKIAAGRRVEAQLERQNLEGQRDRQNREARR